MNSSCTVIIPCFNAQDFVCDAVNSALNQSVLPKYVVVVDDGSTDGSLKLLQTTYAGDSRVRILRHPGGARRGVMASRKLGISEVDTKLVAFLDADDLYKPGKLERQTQLLNEYPEAVMIHGPVNLIYDSLMADSGWKDEFKLSGSRIEYKVHQQPYWLDKNMICNSSAMAKTSAIRPVMNSFFVKQVFQYEDWLTWILLGFRGNFIFDPEPVTTYRFHAGSATASIHNNTTRHFYSYMEFLIQLLIHFPEEQRWRHANAIAKRFQTTIANLACAYAVRDTNAGALIHLLLSADAEPVKDIFASLPSHPVQQEQTAAFVKAFVRAKWTNLKHADKHEKITVFGAGKHTAWLLDAVQDVPGPAIAGIIDENEKRAGERFMGFTIQPARDYVLSAPVLISTDCRQSEMKKRCRSLFGDSVTIIDIYEGLPSGPYPKTI